MPKTAKIILVSQQGRLPWLIKKLTDSRFNHIAILDSDGVIHDFDLKGYSTFNVDQYPWEFEKTTLESGGFKPFQAQYSLLSLLSFPLYRIGLHRLARWIISISTYNCVSWTVKTMGLEKNADSNDLLRLQCMTPADFESFIADPDSQMLFF